MANEVRRRRDELGLTIQEAAARAEIEPMSWKRIAYADANPTLAVMLSVASALGYELSELLM